MLREEHRGKGCRGSGGLVVAARLGVVGASSRPGIAGGMLRRAGRAPRGLTGPALIGPVIAASPIAASLVIPCFIAAGSSGGPGSATSPTTAPAPAHPPFGRSPGRLGPRFHVGRLAAF